ncbi:MAG: DedA family protein [Deltaproteobacteria bacterium]|nr:DedA family protein [Deltaproteobacteria bacterium]
MDSILEYLRAAQGTWQLWVLFAAAAIEYVFPPIPGDTMVLAGGLLVVAGVWPFEIVLLAVGVGGALGASIQYGLGHLLRDENGSLRGAPIIERLAGTGSARKFIEGFRKHGMWMLVFNRMIPGLRTVALLMAGASALRPLPTLLCGMISHVAWSVVLLGAGIALGNNWPLLQEVFEVYWGVMALLCVAGAVFWWRRRAERRARASSQH